MNIGPLLLIFAQFTRVSGVLPRCNIISGNAGSLVKNTRVPSNKSYRNLNSHGSLPGLPGSRPLLGFLPSPLHLPSAANIKSHKLYSSDLEASSGSHGSVNSEKSTVVGSTDDIMTANYKVLEPGSLPAPEYAKDAALSRNDPTLGSSVAPDTKTTDSTPIHTPSLVDTVPTPTSSPGQADKSEHKQLVACQLVPLNENYSGVRRLLSKVDTSTQLQKAAGLLQSLKGLENRLERACGKAMQLTDRCVSTLRSMLYPQGAPEEVLRFTNYKILERILMSFSSSLALNLKPHAQEPGSENIVGFLKGKIAKTKMRTLLFTTVFKDLFSKLLNYYWFNRVMRVSDNPRGYRLMSTFAFSLVTLWDFVINMRALEPKQVLLAVNHVFKQLFTLTNNAINQYYYNSASYFADFSASSPSQAQGANQSTESASNRTATDSSPLKTVADTTPAKLPKEFKDENVFLLDIAGMSLGIVASYLLNEANSNSLKVAAIASSLALNNVLTMFVSSLICE